MGSGSSSQKTSPSLTFRESTVPRTGLTRWRAGPILGALRPFLATLAAALAGGLLCHLLGVPLAWLIGAMLGTAALAWSRPVAVPRAARPLALVVLGLAFGQTFSGPVLAALLGALPVVLLAAALSIAAGVLAAPILSRVAGLDAKTAFYAAVPGGIVIMAVLAQRAGAAVAPVTLAQTLRMVVVVLTVPGAMAVLAPPGTAAGFAAAPLPFDGAGLAVMLALGLAAAALLARTGMANPWMLGPCGLALLAAGFGVLPSSVPPWLLDLAQVAMGASLGQRLTREFLLSSRRLLLASLLFAAVLVPLCVLLGVLLGWAAGLPVGAVMLGLAPGGMPEMGVTAKALGHAVPLVMAFHLTRTLACNFVLGPVWVGLRRLGWR
jgi:membrane AbrB-like protein